MINFTDNRSKTRRKNRKVEQLLVVLGVSNQIDAAVLHLTSGKGFIWGKDDFVS